MPTSFTAWSRTRPTQETSGKRSSSVRHVIASPVSDFLIDGVTFKVGGKSKEKKQVQGIESHPTKIDSIEHQGRYLIGVVPARIVADLYQTVPQC